MVGIIGDSLDQLKNMPTPAKLAVLGAVGAVAFMAYHAHKLGGSTIPLDLAAPGGGGASPGTFSTTTNDPTGTAGGGVPGGGGAVPGGGAPGGGGVGVIAPPLTPPPVPGFWQPRIDPPAFLGPPVAAGPVHPTHPASFATPAARVDVPTIPQHSAVAVAQHLNVQAARMSQLEARGHGVAPANRPVSKPHKLAQHVQQLRQDHLAAMGRDFGV